MDIVSLFLIRELVQGIYDLAVLPLTVADILGRTHYGHVELAAACADLVPVDKVNVRKFSAVKNAVLYGHGLAPAEEYGAEMPVCIHAGKVARLIDISAEL